MVAFLHPPANPDFINMNILRLPEGNSLNFTDLCGRHMATCYVPLLLTRRFSSASPALLPVVRVCFLDRPDESLHSPGVWGAGWGQIAQEPGSLTILARLIQEKVIYISLKLV